MTPRSSPAASSTPTTTSSCRCRALRQWDSLAHVYYDDQLYNGYPAKDVTVVGAAHDSIDKLGKGIAGRGVLLDIARLKGVEWMQAGDVITPADLESGHGPPGGHQVGSGDILVFRTGWRKKFLAERNAHGWMVGGAGHRPGLLRMAARARGRRHRLGQLGHRGAARARTPRPSCRSTWC